MPSRLEALEQLARQSPRNTFTRYALAMEYSQAGNLESAVAEFRAVMDLDPAYVAAYYHCGQALEHLGRLDEARALYQGGIDVTLRSGDTHTRSELQTALDLLG